MNPRNAATRNNKPRRILPPNQKNLAHFFSDPLTIFKRRLVWAIILSASRRCQLFVFLFAFVSSGMTSGGVTRQPRIPPSVSSGQLSEGLTRMWKKLSAAANQRQDRWEFFRLFSVRE